MNILQVIASGGLGGREIQPVILGSEMQKLDHKTYMLVRKNSQSISLIKKLHLPYFELKMNGYLNLRSIIPLVKILRENNIEIIHTHISKSLLFLHVARKLSRKNMKIVLTQRMSINVKKDDIFHRYIFSHIDKIVAISEYVKRNFIKSAPFLKKKIKVVYNGVNIKKEHYDINDRKKFLREFNLNKKIITIGLIGQINKGKGHFWLLNSVKALREKYKINNFKIFFIGKGELIGPLKEFSQRQNLIDKIVFTGYKWNVDYFYRNLDIIIMPSKAEAGGNALLEAMAFGKPVICSNTGAFPEVVINNINSFMVKYNNVEDLANAIFNLIKNPQLRKHLGKNARKIISKRFNLYNTVKHYLEIYSEILKINDIKNR